MGAYSGAGGVKARALAGTYPMFGGGQKGKIHTVRRRRRKEVQKKGQPIGGAGTYSERVRALALSTLTNARGGLATGVNHWLKFARRRGWVEGARWLAGENLEGAADRIMEFGLYLCDDTKAGYGSMVTYMGQARRWVEINGRHRDISLLSRHRAVMRKLKEGRLKQTKRKKPLSGRMLKRWRERLEQKRGGGSQTEWSCWMAMALCFYGLLRGSEVLGRQEKQREGLRWKNVVFVYDGHGEIEAVELFIARSKTDVFGFGATITIYRGLGEKSNPVDMLWAWYNEPGVEEDDFVCRVSEGGSPVSYYLVNKAVKEAAQDMGFEAKDWGTHSGRAGGATALWLGGATGDEVRCAGRWSSDTYLTYLRKDKSLKIRWMAAMATKVTSLPWATPMQDMVGRAGAGG